mgnify:CR=1 FL=1|tara:strand:+ start:2290 stop:2997 length:708 start_codon:yes stop_codon:yes gene_type:complete
MRDAQLQELQRRYLDSGGVEEEAAWVGAALRAGRLSHERVRFAAYLGSPGARRVAPTAARFEDLFAADWEPDVCRGSAPRFLQQVLRSTGKVAAARICASAASVVREGVANLGLPELLEQFDAGLVPLHRCAAGNTGYVRLEVQRAIRSDLLRHRAQPIMPHWFCGFVLKGCLACVRGDGLGFKGAPGLVLWITRRFMNEIQDEGDPHATRLLRRVREEVAPWALQGATGDIARR